MRPDIDRSDMQHSGNEDLHDEYSELVRRIAEDGQDLAGHPAPGPVDALVGELGHYRLIRRLGQGGQGVVYLAEDTRLGREVALKILSTRGAASPDAQERFRREALAASRLRHPGICTVHEAGEVQGQRFLAMEYVDGGGLLEWVEASRTASTSETGPRRNRVDRALQIVEDVARAIEAAHAAGIVHRDLKPQNIMLRSEGSPVVLDFGLARDEDLDSETLTREGDLLGTPAYLPPERVRGEHRPASVQTDVYGLGAILYECLTGARPFVASTREQLYQRILTARVDDPRRHDRAVPREARHVVDTALEKDPERRYASASEFADDVRRLREREAIQARPVPTWLRAARWVQRDPRVAVPTLAAFGALVAGLIVAWSLIGSRDQALRQVRAQALRERVDNLVAESLSLKVADPRVALERAREAFALSADAETRSALYEILAGPSEELDRPIRTVVAAIWADFACDERRLVIVSRRGLQVFRRDGSPVSDLFRAPGGKPVGASLDAERERVAVAWSDGTVRVFAAIDGSLVAELDHPSTFGVAWRSYGAYALVEFLGGDRSLLLTGSKDGGRLWRLDGGSPELVWSEAPREPVCQIAAAPDGEHFAIGDASGSVQVYRTGNSANPELIGRVEMVGAVRALAFDPRRALLAAGCSGDPLVRVCSLDGTPRGALETYGTAVSGLEFSPSGDALLALDDNRSAHLWPTADSESGFGGGRRFTTHDGDVVAAAFSPDGRSLVTASMDTTVRVFDRDGRETMRVNPGSGRATTARFSSDGSRILTGDGEGMVRVWRIDPEGFEVLRHESTVLRIEVSERAVAGALRNGDLVVHDLTTGDRHQFDAGLGDIVWSLAMSADGHRLLAGAQVGGLGAWDLSSGLPKQLGWESSLRDINALAADPSGGSRFVVSHSGGADIIDLNDPSATTSISSLRGLQPLVWAPDGKFLGVAKGRFFLDLVEEDHFPLGIGQTWVKAVAVSSDDRWLALACSPSRILLVDRAERRVVHHLLGHTGVVVDAAFSPDGRLLVSTSRDRSAKVWDVASGELVVTLRGHRGSAIDCAFTPDGSQIVTSGTDGTIRFWPADPQTVESLAEKRSRRVR